MIEFILTSQHPFYRISIIIHVDVWHPSDIAVLDLGHGVGGLSLSIDSPAHFPSLQVGLHSHSVPCLEPTPFIFDPSLCISKDC